MKIQVHKNDISEYVLTQHPHKTKIGKEKYKRWIDVPEYLLIEIKDAGEVSDGYHTFKELYEFRKLYNAALSVN